MSFSLYELSKKLYPESEAHIYEPLWQFRAKFVSRGYFYHKHIQRLLNEIPQHMMPTLEKNDSRFIEKPLRPYITVNNPALNRAGWVIEHYQFFEHALPHDLFKHIYQDPNGLLLKTIAVDDNVYEIRLSNDGRYQKEGELTLKLVNSEGHGFYTVSFVVHQHTPLKHKIAIGGLQGPESTPENNHQIKRLTKTLHGLRPKDLMVKLLVMIANTWEMTEIFAVSNHAHIYRAKRYGNGKRVQANYDTHWKSVGATHYNPDFYSIPLIDPRKAQEDISRPKRAMYRRRYEWLDETNAEFSEILALKKA
jgi:hypothetical protein